MPNIISKCLWRGVSADDRQLFIANAEVTLLYSHNQKLWIEVLRFKIMASEIGNMCYQSKIGCDNCLPTRFVSIMIHRRCHFLKDLIT